VAAQTSLSIVFHFLIDIIIPITERSLKEYPTSEFEVGLETFTKNLLGENTVTQQLTRTNTLLTSHRRMITLNKH